MKTDKNLEDAFGGESKAHMTYLAFSGIAENEGLPRVARLFRAVAEAEKIHALNHLAAMKKVGTTANNLKTAIAGETYEFTEMYPGFIEQAETDSNSKALNSFKDASAVEKIHSVLYEDALSSPGASDTIPYYVCPVCGNTVAGERPERCEVCGAAGGKFIAFES